MSTIEKILPPALEGLGLAHVDFKDDYTAVPEPVDVIENANLITSQIKGAGWHKPVLDIDLPITVLPSSTPGHFHLFIDRSMSWKKYAGLLNALVEAGLIEPGYRDASLARGYTAVRLPWIAKEIA